MSSPSSEVGVESPRSNFLSRMLSGIYSAYSNLNGATLTGAIDVIVVEHQDGSLHCSPFHVRFGKGSVLSSKEKEVEISVNGEAVDGVQMLLGDSGEAFFVEEVPEIEFAAFQAQQSEQLDGAPKKVTEVSPPSKRVVGRKKSVYCKSVQERRDEIANHLICHEEDTESPRKSDLGKSPSRAVQRRKKFTKTRSDTLQCSQDDSSTDEEMFNFEFDSNENDSTSRGNAHRQRRSGLLSLKSMEKQLKFQITEDVIPRLSLQICSEAELSDHELSEVGRVSAAKSDTELDRSDFDDANWGWGRLPMMDGEFPLVGNKLSTPNRRPSRKSVGNRQSSPPAQSKTKGSSPTSGQPPKHSPESKSVEKKISGEVFLDELLPAAQKDPKISEKYFGRPRSTSEIPRRRSRDLPDDLALSLCGGLSSAENGDDPGLEAFEHCRVTFDALCADPSIVDNPSLVVRIGGDLYSWKAAAPLVASLLVFKRTLPSTVISAVRERHMKNRNSPASSTASSPGNTSGWWLWRSSVSHLSDSGVSADETSSSRAKTETPSVNIVKTAPEQSQEYREWVGSHEEVLTRVCGTPFRKTLRLTSEKLKQLGLVPGRNDVEFSVTTSLQGTTRCTCHIFLWHETDKVVISDIDGTITISDILGHVMPMLGKGWEHLGVATLFNKVANNNYKFIYLSARAIGQAGMTRGYLKSIRQDSLSLPEGPVLLNPTSLLNAFHREVIIKRPQDFKISCLKDIMSLFPMDSRPFYAGFGNRLTDVLSYRAVSIETQRIFTINPKGELTRELVATSAAVTLGSESSNITESGDDSSQSQANSSYKALSDIADEIFPPLVKPQAGGA
ncbi:phosphatidate phosphatase LPIN2 [Galendromus occidentalis]|uniref:phosphatidate phosphatase n=1 Tax=Galendromus occidentalis TaxID=34638 RepID=A0AAJ7SFS1_9ACAR|nr:phosphatidate phosphatase LPIN2 [Galendromus occidentalis]